jgi:hypothetical protein
MSSAIEGTLRLLNIVATKNAQTNAPSNANAK